MTMNVKFLLYIVVTISVIVALDSVNINNIFKKNKVLGARLLYLLIAFSLIYLVTNFIYDFAVISKIF